MKISVTRTGGFAGLSENLVSLDTAALPADAAAKINQRLDSVGFFEPPGVGADELRGADLYHYDISVVDGPQSHSVGFEDDFSPRNAKLRQLVDWLVELRQ